MLSRLKRILTAGISSGRDVRRPVPKKQARNQLRLENLEDRVTPAAAFPEFLDPNPAPGNQFGANVVPLSTGNVIVTSPFDDAGGTDAGAVYLFNGSTGALISTLRGSTANDLTSASVRTLPNGNFVVTLPVWDNGPAVDAGAVIHGNGTTGVSGVVSAANSLVGSTAGDQVGGTGLTTLSNGNYILRSANWDNGAAVNAGAVTWVNGAVGITGVVSAANSLVGSTTGDQVGFPGLVALSNGNYVVVSTSWDNGGVADAGAATWVDGTVGITGVVSAANSLVGSTANDQVGASGLTTLSNGNYVLRSLNWDNGLVVNAGAVTWVNGAVGITGVISATNSLVGSSANDQVGTSVSTLSNGNYVVRSTTWDNGLAVNAGAVTWGSGTTGVAGVVSAANSLVGSTANDQVGNPGLVPLPNGNYVVVTTGWDNGGVADAGAATFGDGMVGITGVVSAANSLVGSTAGDQVGGTGLTTLSNGNYVLRSANWDNGAAVNAGAVTWVNGSVGITGVVSAANSLVGSTANDQVGITSVTVLSNGNYVVVSSSWDNGGVADAGAATFGNGTVGITGVVSAANSLVGSTANDQVGGGTAKTSFGLPSTVGGVTALTNGNYLVRSPYWDNGGVVDAGAVTWGSGTTGVAGVISAANSLVGSSTGDQLAGGVIITGLAPGIQGGVTALANGNYLVRSPYWDNGGVVDAGAVTFGNGVVGITGVVSAANSLVGSTTNDQVGGGGATSTIIPTPAGGVTVLPNGNYVVRSPVWDNGVAVDAGAATFGSATTGVTGVLSAANSLVGSSASDRVGNSVLTLGNGNYVVISTSWDNGPLVDAGATTFGNGTTGVCGTITAANSLVGSSAGDKVGNSVLTLGNGNYVVISTSWDNGPLVNAGATTFGNGTTGVWGTITAVNSAIGSTASAGLSGVVVDIVNGTFYARFALEGGGRVRVGSQTSGFFPNIAAPATLTAYEDVDQPITTVSIGDGGSSLLSFTLSVNHGILTLGSTANLTVSGNGTGLVTLTGTTADLNAALATLVYRGNLNYSGPDTLSLAANDGFGSGLSTSVAITVKSAAQQAADLQAKVSALKDAGVLNKGQANSLIVKLNLQGNNGDVGKVQAFLNEVAALFNAGILTQEQADDLLYWGNILLLSVMRR